MLLMLTLFACEGAPAIVSRPTEARFERFCRAETVAEMKEAEVLHKAFVQEVLLKQGWAYEGPLYNDGINCTVTLWTR